MAVVACFYIRINDIPMMRIRDLFEQCGMVWELEL